MANTSKELIAGTGLAELELVTRVPGRRLFWSMVRNSMVSRGDSGLLLTSTMDSSVGGMLSEDMFKYGCWYVVTRRSCLSSNGLRFRSSRQEAIFFHELCHYVHLVLNGGKFTEVQEANRMSKEELTESPWGRLAVELEAWGISRRMDGIFSMKLLESIDRANSRNMYYASRQVGILHKSSRTTYDDWLAEVSTWIGDNVGTTDRD